MRAPSVRLLLSAALCLAAVPASAQDGELPASFTSDRPGFANTTGVAARGRLTTELGVSASFGDVPEGSLPDLSVRVGLFEFLEARVRGPSGIARFDGGPTAGLGDPSAGFKIGGRLHESLALSSVWEVTVPLATDGFGAPEAGFRADLNLDWAFFGPLTLTPNAAASVRAEPDGLGGTRRLFEGAGSLKLTWQVLDVLALYVQSYVLKSEISDWRVQVGGGLAWMVAPNVQLDASFDAGVSEEGDPPTAGLGTSILW